MRARFTQYLNEIVSLTIMGLMCVALVAGRAGAAPQVSEQAEAATSSLHEPGASSFIEDRLRLVENPELEIDITFRIRHTGE